MIEDMFRDFGTALYLRRGMQKRAADGKVAVDYLARAGALDAEDGEYGPAQSAATAAKGIAAGAGAGAALYGAGRLANAARRKFIDSRYLRDLGHEAFFGGSGAARTKEEIVNAAGGGMARKIRDVDTMRNRKALGFLKKVRNPLLLGGALAGSAIASKKIYDDARAAADRRRDAAAAAQG